MSTLQHGQLDLFPAVIQAYVSDEQGLLSNEQLYDRAAQLAGLTEDDYAPSPVGRNGIPHSTLKRKIRWHQQTLKHAGVLQSVQGRRGVWALADPEGSQSLRSEEHTSELQSLMRNSYAVYC